MALVQTRLFEFDPSAFRVIYPTRAKFERYHDTYNKELAKLGFTRIIHLFENGEVIYDHCVSMPAQTQSLRKGSELEK